MIAGIYKVVSDRLNHYMAAVCMKILTRGRQCLPLHKEERLVVFRRRAYDE